MNLRSILGHRVVFPLFDGFTRNGRIRNICEILAWRLIDEKAGFSYEFDKNGESELITSCISQTGTVGKPFIVFDVGANTGDWAERVLNVDVQGKLNLHAFEISMTTFEALTKRIGTDLQSEIFLNHMALSDHEGDVHFNRFPSAETVNTLLTDSTFWKHLPYAVETVPATTGDLYCAKYGIGHIDLLKIDTEGWEWLVLQGFTGMLNDRAINVIQFEYGYTHADLHKLMGDFYRFFEELGYVVGPLRKTGVEFRGFKYSDNEFKSGPNYVAALPEVATLLHTFP